MFLHPLGLLALGALPIVIGLHLYKRRFQPRVVSALFLWSAQDRLPLAGRKRERLRQNASFWCELAAATLLALAFAGPRLLGTGRARHMVVVLDGSASMAARGSRGMVSERARELVLERVAELPGGSRVTLIESGGRPRILAGPAAFPAEARLALADWQPSAPAHALEPALVLGQQLAGEGEVLLVTDHDLSESLPEGIAFEALGEPVDNLAITHASRRRVADASGVRKDEISIALTNAGRSARKSSLRLLAEDQLLEEREVTLAPLARSVLSFRLPADAPCIEARLEEDALALDDHAYLAPIPPRTVALKTTLDAEEAQRLGLDDPRLGPSPIERWLAIVPDSIEAPTAESAHLVLTAGAPPAGGAWCLSIERGAGEPTPWIGPFLIDRAHPLVDGLTLEGLVWAGWEKGVSGVPLVAAGSNCLLGEEELDGRMLWRMSYASEASTLTKSPDWPILLANLAELRRARLPGPASTNLVVGESFRYQGLGPGSYRIEGPGLSRQLESRGVLVVDELERPGLYTLSGEQGELCRIAQSFCDAQESDLQGAASAKRPSARLLATLESGFSWIEIVLLLMAIAAILLDWLVLARGRLSPGEPTRALVGGGVSAR